jgi:hypothetical protein
MQAITIYRAKNLDKAVHRQEAMPKAVPLSEQQLNAWKDLEGFLGNRREYFNGDDGNIWLIANSLFLYKVSPDGFSDIHTRNFLGKPFREKVRIVGILRQNEDSKELVFDSEIFDNSDEHQSYARKNNLLLA